ncbi:MAG: GNAT family N-acetyltransferase [Owenweeksia sp.]
MELSIRKAELKDSGSLAELSHQLGYISDDNAIQKRLEHLLKDRNHCVFVAVKGDKVLGWIHGFYTLRVESDAFVEIGGLVVDNHHRQKGIGRMLVEQVIDWSLSRECEKLRVRSNVIRTDSHRFYENLGFTTNKEQKVLDRHLDPGYRNTRK